MAPATVGHELRVFKCVPGGEWGTGSPVAWSMQGLVACCGGGPWPAEVRWTLGGFESSRVLAVVRWEVVKSWI